MVILIVTKKKISAHCCLLKVLEFRLNFFCSHFNVSVMIVKALKTLSRDIKSALNSLFGALKFV